MSRDRPEGAENGHRARGHLRTLDVIDVIVPIAIVVAVIVVYIVIAVVIFFVESIYH